MHKVMLVMLFLNDLIELKNNNLILIFMFNLFINFIYYVLVVVVDVHPVNNLLKRHIDHFLLTTFERDHRDIMHREMIVLPHNQKQAILQIVRPHHFFYL